MAKSLEERLHICNENFAKEYQTIEKAKGKIKELKSQRSKIENQIEKEKLIQLTAFLKKQGITSVDDFQSLLDITSSEDEEDNGIENT
ncbi:MAG: hypothetical protein ACI4RI_05420 [Ruminococcus sp.]